MKAICFRFFHSSTVRVFFLLFAAISCLSLISGFVSPGELFVQTLGDLGPPALGLSIFSAVYLGPEFRRRTFQNQIAHGEHRIVLLGSHFLLLILVFLILVYINAGLPTLLWTIQRGDIGESYQVEYLMRLCVPAVLLTAARGVGLFVFPFLFRDSVKNLLVSVVYSLLVPVLTQSDRETFPYIFYSSKSFPFWTSFVIGFLSIGVLVLAFSFLALYFRRISLK